MALIGKLDYIKDLSDRNCKANALLLEKKRIENMQGSNGF